MHPPPWEREYRLALIASMRRVIAFWRISIAFPSTRNPTFFQTVNTSIGPSPFQSPIASADVYTQDSSIFLLHPISCSVPPRYFRQRHRERHASCASHRHVRELSTGVSGLGAPVSDMRHVYTNCREAGPVSELVNRDVRPEG